MKTILLILTLAFTLPTFSQSREPVTTPAIETAKPCPSKGTMIAVFWFNYFPWGGAGAFLLNWHYYGECWLWLTLPVILANPEKEIEDAIGEIQEDE